MVVFVIILQRGVVIAVIAGDPATPGRRTIKGALRNAGRKVLRKISARPLNIAFMFWSRVLLPCPGTI